MGPTEGEDGEMGYGILGDLSRIRGSRGGEISSGRNQVHWVTSCLSS
jgi:hypothetical protein